MASRWASSSHSEIPEGHTRTGWAMPGIPGSKEADDNRISMRRIRIPQAVSILRKASTSRPSSNGTDVYIAIDTFRQRAYHTERTARSPQTHTAARTTGSKRTSTGDSVEEKIPELTGAIACERGRPTWSIAKFKRAVVSVELHARCLPMTTGSEKGIRNFSEAASHSR